MNTNSNNRLPAYIIACACLLLVIAASVFCHRLSITLQHAGMYDFGIFFDTCRHFIETGQLYDRDLAAYEPLAPVYKFPPLSAAVMVQIERAGVSAATLAGMGGWLEIMLFVLPTLLLASTLFPVGKSVAVLSGIFIVCVTGPTLEENITRLQLEPVLFACCALSLLLLLKQQDFLAGMLMGLAVCLKLYPAVMVFYFLLTRRWLALAGIIAVTLLATMYSVWVLGLQEHVFFLRDLLPVLLRENPIKDPESVSIASWAHALGLLPAYAKILSQGLLLLALFLAARWVLMNKITPAKTMTEKDLVAAGFSAFLLAMLIGMPNPLWNYQILLVIPVTVIAGQYVRKVIECRQPFEVMPVVVLVCVAAALHIGAASTVDDAYYPASFVQKILISLLRTSAPFVLFGLLLARGRKKITSFS
ncbi:MAG TPA: glycosyltransferase family 87 protein [Pseudomonadales bacterium]|nr:glycosyltransferase family 87 protein [Pseudomonadales bacterium]